ncbi:MAG TPA: rhomboid family intramembrane serine protease, partial [Thermoanaerobaculia bacterium]|nr:rhomboid family intramembrane serine protease [Thermoanaerobaculia bacterium]
MIPIGDDNSDRLRTPIVNWLLVGINVFVFVVLQGMGSNERFTLAYATVPAEILTGRDVAQPIPIRDEYGRVVARMDLEPTPISVYLTLLTAMFMHGSIAHLAGNMLYLWIFGDNLEHTLGRARYLFFYLATGIAAGLAHILANGASGVPSVGASGAISGILGGYLLLFPRNRVRVLMGYYGVTAVPAYVMLGMWILLQFVSGVGEVARTEQTG